LQLRFAPQSGQLIAGASVQVPFTEGSGTVAHDISGNNDCIFAAGVNAPAWVTGGIDYLSPSNGVPLFCAFPASVTLSDASETNARTRTWCGYLRPIADNIPFADFAVVCGIWGDDSVYGLQPVGDGCGDGGAADGAGFDRRWERAGDGAVGVCGFSAGAGYRGVRVGIAVEPRPFLASRARTSSGGEEDGDDGSPLGFEWAGEGWMAGAAVPVV
jgi:hypothetical protein